MRLLKDCAGILWGKHDDGIFCKNESRLLHKFVAAEGDDDKDNEYWSGDFIWL